MEGVVLRRLSTVACGYKLRADLSGVSKQTGRMCIYVAPMIPLLLVHCACRSPARKSDPDFACHDPFSLVLFRFSGDYRNGVSMCVGVEYADA